jgi:hypothetical protein
LIRVNVQQRRAVEQGCDIGWRAALLIIAGAGSGNRK